MTVVAITAATLTTLKYYPKHDDEINSYDDDYVEYHNNYISTTTDRSHEIVKRSSDEVNIVQYSIDDRNPSMIDEAKREKVKEVLTTATTMKMKMCALCVIFSVTCYLHIFSLSPLSFSR